MKKNTRRFLGVILALLMTLSSVASFTLGVSAQGGVTVYVSESGDDANAGTGIDKPVRTLATATKLAGEDGTVIVMDSVDVGTGDKILGCTIRGLNPNSVINMTGWCMRFSGPVTIENITVNAKVAWSYILAQGYRFVVGEGVTVTADEGITTALSIRGGGDGLEIAGSCELVIKSGAWKNVVGGTRNKDTKGNTHITIYDTATAQAVNIGNENGADITSEVKGSATVKLVGKSNPVPGSISGKAAANCYIDITEYEGAVPDSWYNSGITIITDKTKVPEDAIPSSKGGVVGVPGKKYDTGEAAAPKLSDVRIYLSDNGNDANDGKTIGNAVKTLARANTLAGSGGTIIIADTFTTPGGTITAARLEGFNPDCVFKMTGWQIALGANCEIDNLTIDTAVNWSFLLANGFKLTIGENVTTVKSDKATVYLSVRGGGEKKSISGNTNVILKGGNWNVVYAGTKAGVVSGNTNVTVYPGAAVNTVSFGNDAPSATDTIGGKSILKLMGDKTQVAKIGKSTLPKGGCYIDISEFDGTLPESFDLEGVGIISRSGVTEPVIVEKTVELPTTGNITDVVPGTGVVYLSDNGSNENDGKTPEKPVKSLDNAMSKGGKNPTVVIVDSFTAPGATLGACRFVGYSSESAFNIPAWAIRLSGDAEFENITIVHQVKYSYLLAMGYSLTIGEGVTVAPGAGVTTKLGVRGGGDGQALGNDSNVVLMSGDWGDIHGGTRNASVNGNTFITICEGASVTSLNIGNNGIKEGNVFNGNGVIKLVGRPSVGGITQKPDYQTGDMILDLTEFTGSFKDEWSDIGARVVVDKAELPDFVTAHFEGESTESAGSESIPMNMTALFINGYPDGTFLPERVMTRAEAITVASKVAGLDDSFEASGKTAFEDLKADDWYAKNVKYLEHFGALDFLGSTLDADKGITRGEFVKLISGMIGRVEGDAPVFSDVAATHPYYNDIIAAAKAGLVTGYPDGTFLPDNTLKRSEIVTVLNRLTKRNTVSSNTAKVTRFSDIQGHWAAPQIIAASCEAVTDGILLWYSGEVMSANSPVDKSTVELSVTKAVLDGVDVTDAKAVAEAIEAYAVKRRAEIANTATSVNVTGTKYYVSANGDDSRDGKTPETAWKTLEKVNRTELSAGDGVFFRRGDIFRGQLLTMKGVTYSAYSENDGDTVRDKPAIYGSKRNYSNSGFWLPTSKPNVYVSAETFATDVGLIVFDEGKEVGLKEALGLKSFIGAVTKDLQFFHDKNDSKLYLYSESDPNTRWTSTEIAEGRHGIAGNGNGVTIDNLCIKYVGAHGIGYGKTEGLTVQNCEIGWIGGMLQDTASRIVRYGNGVEIYTGCKDYTVTNCHIYQVYDAGVTHQDFNSKTERIDMENIKYTDNVIEYCTYDIEYVNAQSEDNGGMKNVEISGNLLLHGGEGWGQQRGDSTPAVIKGWSEVNHAISAVYTDNVIMTEAPKCVLLHLGVGKYSYMPELYGNLIVGKRGAMFGFYGLMTENIWHVYDEKITDTTIGLDDNTMIFLD